MGVIATWRCQHPRLVLGIGKPTSLYMKHMESSQHRNRSGSYSKPMQSSYAKGCAENQCITLISIYIKRYLVMISMQWSLVFTFVKMSTANTFNESGLLLILSTVHQHNPQQTQLLHHTMCIEPGCEWEILYSGMYLYITVIFHGRDYSMDNEYLGK